MPDHRTYFSSPFKLGILGGGQLGKMLLTETRRYDIQTKIMDPMGSAPARIGSNEFVQGDLNDESMVVKFGEDCDLITIEIENVNIDALKILEKQGKKIFPKPSTLEIIKNKCRQKEFYRENKIPTAPFKCFKRKKELLDLVEQGSVTFPFVWKAATGGYDGRGVQVIKNQKGLEDIPDEEGLCEEFIPFDKELAIIIARSENGEIKSYPLVEMDFHPKANLVEYVFSPSEAGQKAINQAESLAQKIVRTLDHVGLLAVEMFLTLNGDIIVNEVAPRVHNSGHLSIEGNVTSQFEQHIRAILGLPLGDTSTLHPSVMINLNGEKDHTGPVIYEGIEEIMTMSGVYVHLYGKAETRPFRKMGHVTVIGETLEEARKIAKTVKETIKVKSIQ